ncbi:MAG TPA: hypothetical protein DEQ80_09515 [Anaerolinea thermolimosa]|uniref:Glycosyltransferase RgtA/B/C/D-like domain-containing protein n=1 Tax=Anaerolinea thermolimosa TaxID=229919 RepID=A0A3D1JIN5_9CHLR|nr:hypothetical protein ATHL_01940 [Anaerolinea thermolimosa]HCE18085.1 hypothetical protein [Anaerolinea thermolimosa]
MSGLIRRVSRMRYEWVLLLLAVLLQGHIPFSQPDVLLNWYSTDDAFYYYKVAQNITEGRGITFDGINQTNGFHPLWMLICIPIFALARYDLILPLRLLVVVLIALNTGTGLLLYRWLGRWIDRPIAGLAAAFWVFWPAIHGVTTQKGLEAGINAFFVVLLLVVATSDTANDGVDGSLKVGLIAALALFSRLDNVFVVFCVGIWYTLYKQRLGIPALSLILVGAISIFSSFYLRLGFGRHIAPFLGSIYGMLVIGLGVKLVTFFWMGVVQGAGGLRKSQIWMRFSGAVVLSSLLTGGIMVFLNLVGVVPTFPRLVIVYDLGITLVLGGWVYAGLLYSGAISGLSQPPQDLLKTSVNQWLRRGLGYFLPLSILLGGYMIWNWAAFGTPMPVSGQVKHWWGSVPDTVYGQPADSFLRLLGISSNPNVGSWWLALSPFSGFVKRLIPGISSMPEAVDGIAFLILLGVAGLLFWAGRSRLLRRLGDSGWLVLFSGSLLQTLYYGGTLYANTRTWYWVNHSLAIVALGGFGLDVVFRFMEEKIGNLFRTIRIGLLSAAGLTVVMIFVFQVGSVYYPRTAEGEGSMYRLEAQKLMALTEPGAKIGMTGGGAVAYFLQGRTVVNLDGLINSYEYFQSMKAETARAFIDRMGLDYVYSNAYIVTSSYPYYKSLKDRLVYVGAVFDTALFRYVQDQSSP